MLLKNRITSLKVAIFSTLEKILIAVPNLPTFWQMFEYKELLLNSCFKNLICNMYVASYSLLLQRTGVFSFMATYGRIWSQVEYTVITGRL